MSTTEVSSTEELLAAVTLGGIEFFEISARSRAGFGESIGTDEPEPPEFDLKLQARAGSFQVRLRTALSVPQGDVVVDAGVMYELSEELKVSEEIGLDFANRVALMALLPYVREAIHTHTVKVFGEGLLMPIIRQGDLVFSADEVDDPTAPGEVATDSAT
ncbi:hypothetical protein [Arthrobacter sp. D2-10]